MKFPLLETDICKLAFSFSQKHTSLIVISLIICICINVLVFHVLRRQDDHSKSERWQILVVYQPITKADGFQSRI